MTNVIKKSIITLSLILTGFLIYSNSFFCGFHFSDYNYIVDNPAIRSISDFSRIWKYLTEHTRFIPIYSFALNYHFSQLNPWSWHLVNIIIHIINALLVRTLMLRTLTLGISKTSPWSQQIDNLSTFIAFLFLTHPLQTQSVTFITQRINALATFFYLSGLCLYLKGRIANPRNFRCWFTLGCGAAFLGLLCKETVFTWPLMIVLYEAFFFANETHHFLRNKKIMGGALLAIVSSFALFKILYPWPIDQLLLYQRESWSHDGDILIWSNYWLTQFPVIITYLRLLIFPINQNLDYDFPAAHSLFELPVFLSLLFLLLLLWIAIKLFRTKPLISLGIAWYFLTSTIESSFMPIPHVIFEHRTYLPSIGFFLAMVGLTLEFSFRPRWIFTFWGIVIVLFGWLTFQRNKVWFDEVTLWSDVTQKTPNKARGWLNLGLGYLTRHEPDKALPCLLKSIEIKPDYYEAYNNLGLLYQMKNDFPAAIKYWDKAISLRPGVYTAYLNQANIFIAQGNLDKALSNLNTALKINNKHPDIYIAHGNLLRDTEKYSLALEDYAKSLAIDAQYLPAYENRGVLYLKTNHISEALADFQSAITLNPNQPSLYFNRALAYKAQGTIDKAYADFSRAIDLKKDYIEAFYNRGNLLFNKKLYSQAIEDYSRAISLNPTHAASHFNRSKSYYLTNSFEKALSDALAAKSLGFPNIEGYITQIETTLTSKK